MPKTNRSWLTEESSRTQKMGMNLKTSDFTYYSSIGGNSTKYSKLMKMRTA